MTFDIVISHDFPKVYIEISHVVEKIWRFSPSMLTFFIDFVDIFLTFPCCKNLLASHKTDDDAFLLSGHSKSFFSNFTLDFTLEFWH